MSDSFDRIGHEAGEWFERYVEDIFRFAGFVTERDRLFFDNVKHEIDVWAESSFATVAVECKDWAHYPEQNIKKEFDAFIAKVQRIGASKGVFAVNVPDRGQLERYRRYLASSGLALWDSKEVEKWHEDILRYREPGAYLKRLCDSLKIVVRDPTKTERAVGILKGLGRFTIQSANATAKVAADMGLIEKKRAKKRKKRTR